MRTVGVTLPHSGPASSHVKGERASGKTEHLSDRILTEVLEQPQPCSLRLKPLRAHPSIQPIFIYYVNQGHSSVRSEEARLRPRTCVPLFSSSTATFLLSLSHSHPNPPTPPRKFSRLRRTSALSHLRLCPPQECTPSPPQLEAQNLWPRHPAPLQGSPDRVLPDGRRKSACVWHLFPTSVGSLSL